MDRFQTDFNVLPGGDEYQFEADIGRLKSCVTNIMSECYKGIVYISYNFLFKIIEDLCL